MPSYCLAGVKRLAKMGMVDGAPGMSALDMNTAEDMVVRNTREVVPGMIICGMEVSLPWPWVHCGMWPQMPCCIPMPLLLSPPAHSCWASLVLALTTCYQSLLLGLPAC